MSRPIYVLSNTLALIAIVLAFIFSKDISKLPRRSAVAASTIPFMLVYWNLTPKAWLSANVYAASGAIRSMEAPAVTALISYDGDHLLKLQIGSKTLDGSGYYVRINDDTTIYSINAYDMENIIAVAQYGFAAPADTAQN